MDGLSILACVYLTPLIVFYILRTRLKIRCKKKGINKEMILEHYDVPAADLIALSPLFNYMIFIFLLRDYKQLKNEIDSTSITRQFGPHFNFTQEEQSMWVDGFANATAENLQPRAEPQLHGYLIMRITDVNDRVISEQRFRAGSTIPNPLENKNVNTSGLNVLEEINNLEATCQYKNI